MPEKDLDDPDVYTPLEHVRGEAMTQRVRSEIGVEAAGVPRLDKCGPCGRIRQVGGQPPAGKEPPLAAVGFQTSRSIWSVDSVSGRIRSLFRLPMTRRTICLESTAVTGSVTASLIRKP